MIFYSFIINYLLIINLIIIINNLLYHLIHIIFIASKYLISFQIYFILYISIENHILIQYHLFKSFILHFIIILIL